jgi:TonB dependent receptor
VAGYGAFGNNFNVERNWHNFAPRLGIAYQVTPKTVIRMGYGRSYDLGVFGSIFGHVVTQNLPVLASQNNTSPTQYADAFTLATGPPAPPSPTIPSNGLLPEPVGVSSHSRPNRMRLARVDAYNVTIQRQVTNTVSAEIAYVGNRGHGFYQNNPDMNINQASVVGFPTLSTDQRRPFFSKFGWTQDIIFLGNNASNYYDSLQTKVNKRSPRPIRSGRLQPQACVFLQHGLRPAIWQGEALHGQCWSRLGSPDWRLPAKYHHQLEQRLTLEPNLR